MMINEEDDSSQYMDPYIAALDVEKILKNGTPNEQSILCYFKRQKRFKYNDKNRREVGKAVANTILKKKQKFTSDDKKQLAIKIAKTFDGEDSTFWFATKDEGGPRGYFHYAIRNIKFRVNQQRSVTPPPEHTHVQEVNELLNSKLEYLNDNIDCKNWNDTLDAWNATRVLRKQDLDANKKEEDINKKKKIKNDNTAVNRLYSVENYINKWKNFESDKGPALVLSDFRAWYPSASKFSIDKMKNLNDDLKLIRNQLKLKKWSDELDDLDKTMNPSTNVNVKFALLLLSLPYLIPPHGRTSPKNKTDIKSCRDSLIILVKDVNEIEKKRTERADELNKRNSTLQPMLFVIGNNWMNIDQIYLCIDNIQWKMENLAVGFDVLFKSFYVFDTSFPKESDVLWSIIQKKIYEMDLPSINPLASGIIVDLKKIVKPHSSNSNILINNIQHKESLPSPCTRNEISSIDKQQQKKSQNVSISSASTSSEISSIEKSIKTNNKNLLSSTVINNNKTSFEKILLDDDDDDDDNDDDNI